MLADYNASRWSAAPDGSETFEVRKGLEQPSAPPPPYVCIANFWVRSAEQFGATFAQHGDELYGGIPRFTNLQPVHSWEKVLSSS